jgi:S1-C subfamily serine protease
MTEEWALGDNHRLAMPSPVRFLLILLAFLTLASPARADDVSAAGRGVVRIVTIAVIDDEVVGFGHGSGFAVSGNRVVTNAHVVELAARYPGNVIVGVVPSAGDKSFQARVIAVDTARDLALLEVSPLPFGGGTVLINSPPASSAAARPARAPGRVRARASAPRRLR